MCSGGCGVASVVAASVDSTGFSWSTVPIGACSFTSKGDEMLSLLQLSTISSVEMPPLACRLLLADLALSLPTLFGLTLLGFDTALEVATFGLSRFMRSLNDRLRPSSPGKNPALFRWRPVRGSVLGAFALFAFACTPDAVLAGSAGSSTFCFFKRRISALTFLNFAARFFG